MLGQPKSSYNSVAMNIRQVDPNPDAEQNCPKVIACSTSSRSLPKEKAEYFVAVHKVSDGRIRTACQCMSAIFNFARRQEPCCKHATEAVKIVDWELGRSR